MVWNRQSWICARISNTREYIRANHQNDKKGNSVLKEKKIRFEKHEKKIENIEVAQLEELFAQIQAV